MDSEDIGDRYEVPLMDPAELLEIMLYWHDKDGRVDESWWAEARRIVARAKR